VRVAGDGRSMEELEEERDFLLRSLDDLDRERTAGDLDPADYMALKDDYTARAAAVLRAIDRSAAGRRKRPAGAPQPDWARYRATGAGRTGTRTAERAPGRRAASARAPRAPRRARPWLVGTVVLAFAVFGGVLVARGAGEREPGQSSSGSVTATGPSAQLARARQLMGQGRFLDALKTYDAVLAKDPGQPEALTYRGWLIRLTGKADKNPALIDRGLASIDKAIVADADYPDAHLFRGIILFEDKADAAAAVPDLQLYLARSPASPMAPSVQDLLARARAAASGATTSTTAAPAG